MANTNRVSTTASSRLKQDYMRLNKNPVPYVRAMPLPSNILVWHYVVSGPENTPYEGGYYHGKLVFPREFPFKPPAIYMITPNGRFKVNQKLCLSISDFHPDTWNPAWSVSTILTGLLSFMVETTPTSGSTESTEATKRRLAQETKEFNLKDKTFCELFPDIVKEIADLLEEKRKADEEKESQRMKEQVQSQQNGTIDSTLNDNQTNWLLNTNILSNMFVMLGLTAFAFVVRYVFNTIN